MDVTTPAGAIVVGVDASPDSERAVTWALEVAGPSRRPVHLVHVQSSAPSYVVDQLGREKWERAGETLLDEATTRARRSGDVTITRQTLFRPGSATAEALVAAAQEASLLVVGARGHGGFAGLLTGSVSQHVARHAPCPVAVVRDPGDAQGDRVVVGVDDSDGAQDALALAFEIASQRGVGLTAIHAWQAPALHGPGVVLPMPVDVGEQLGEEKRGLALLLSPWEQKYPGVTVTPEAIPGHPAEALADASERAALVVVGSRGRGTFRGLLLGSVGQEVLHRARCPVLVAR